MTDPRDAERMIRVILEFVDDVHHMGGVHSLYDTDCSLWWPDLGSTYHSAFDLLKDLGIKVTSQPLCTECGQERVSPYGPGVCEECFNEV
jgi:hypothetical protein